MLGVDSYFLNPNRNLIDIETNLPTTRIYRNWDRNNGHRLGWASYRPAEIQPNTTYTVTLFSPPTGVLQTWARVQETYGFRIPFDCLANCWWVPIRWCWINEGEYSILLRPNQHPAGIHPLGQPEGQCRGLAPAIFLPVVLG